MFLSLKISLQSINVFGNIIKIGVRVSLESLSNLCEKNWDFKFFAIVDATNHLCFDISIFRKLVFY